MHNQLGYGKTNLNFAYVKTAICIFQVHQIDVGLTTNQPLLTDRVLNVESSCNVNVKSA